jgi:isocitrate dehydrogenase
MAAFEGPKSGVAIRMSEASSPNLIILFIEGDGNRPRHLASVEGHFDAAVAKAYKKERSFAVEVYAGEKSKALR